MDATRKHIHPHQRDMRFHPRPTSCWPCNLPATPFSHHPGNKSSARRTLIHRRRRLEPRSAASVTVDRRLICSGSVRPCLRRCGTSSSHPSSSPRGWVNDHGLPQSACRRTSDHSISTSDVPGKLPACKQASTNVTTVQHCTHPCERRPPASVHTTTPITSPLACASLHASTQSCSLRLKQPPPPLDQGHHRSLRPGSTKSPKPGFKQQC